MSAAVTTRPTPPWRVVAARELRDVWLTGLALPLMLGSALLLGVMSYLTASNEELNFLEQRETVSLTLQVAVAIAALVVLVVAGDSFSGERERGTLEALLLSPAPRSAIVVGKAVGALSLYLGAYVVAAPFVWYLARGTGAMGVALLGGFLVGALLALFSCGLGLLVSSVVSSSRLSQAVSLFILIALYVPTLLPSGTQHGWFSDLLLRIDPYAAGLRYLGWLVANAHGVADDLAWLVGPVVAAIVVPAVAILMGERLALGRGDRA